MKIFITIFFIIWLSFDILAEIKTPCGRAHFDFCYEGKMLKNGSPPLSIQMPYEIMKAYLTLSEITTHTNYQNFGKFLSSQTGLTDTIRSLFRDYFLLQDYDALLLNKYNLTDFIDSVFTYKPIIYERDLKQYIYNNSTPLDYMLLNREFIFHIKVSDLQKINSAGNNYYMVSSDIIDTIKGKVIPDCSKIIMPLSSYETDSLTEAQPAVPSSCFIFGMRDETNKIVTAPYDEYITFGALSNLCIDSTNNFENFYYNIVHNKYPDWQLIPVSNGMALDTDNVFGFGINLTVDEWKQKLRKRINEIKNGLLPETGVDDIISNENQICIFPNPASEKITIETFIEYPSKIYLSINNQLGNEVYKVNNVKIYDRGKHLIELEVSNLRTGIYYCILKTGNNIISQKLVVIH